MAKNVAKNERLFWYSLLASFLVILLLGFSNPACFAQSTEPPDYVIKIKSHGFVPAFAAVNSGTTVIWKNEDSKAHFLTVEGLFEEQGIVADTSFGYKFSKPGVYECRIADAVGIVIVD